MPAIDRTGQVFGDLTVISDNGNSQLLCRCKCGREGNYPRTLTKPSYRGPKSCPWCLGTICEECGTIIPNKGRMPAKTCSEACRLARTSRRGRERYERIKDTEHYRATRAAYLERLNSLMDADPELAESIREDHRRAVCAWRERQMADPVLRARYKDANQKREAQRLERIRADPRAYAELLRKRREWYNNLSDEDYHRIFIESREERAKRT